MVRLSKKIIRKEIKRSLMLWVDDCKDTIEWSLVNEYLQDNDIDDMTKVYERAEEHAKVIKQEFKRIRKKIKDMR